MTIFESMVKGAIYILLIMCFACNAQDNPVENDRIEKQDVEPSITEEKSLQEKTTKNNNDDDKYQSVEVADPFVEFHSGPGRGYPVFHIVERGELLILIKKKTQWYKVKSPRGKLGWVHEDQMIKTLTPGGENFDIGKSTQTDFVKRDFEAGVLGGDFGGATVLTLYGGWSWTPNISTELAISQAIGDVSEIQFASINIMHQPFPEWIVSPYFKLGAGRIHTEPSATIIEAEDRSDGIVHAGLGVRVYASRHFFLRAEYNSHTILTSRNDNDKVEEWKIGFSVFF